MCTVWHCRHCTNNTNMADFAKAQLLKYGWTEGRGLGKNESGISEAIKPKLKFDHSGIGHDPAEQFTYHWWENVFNEASKNISVNSTDEGVSMNVLDTDTIGISHKKSSLRALKKHHTSRYGNFLKTSTLLQDGKLVPENNSEAANIIISNSKLEYSPLTDEDLFKACGGRTAHKGARHGLNLNGKLARIAAQEKELLAGTGMDASEQFPKIMNEPFKLAKSRKRHKCKKNKRSSIESSTSNGDSSSHGNSINNEIDPQPSCSYTIDRTPDDDTNLSKPGKKAKKNSKKDSDEFVSGGSMLDDNANTIEEDEFVVPPIMDQIRPSIKSKSGKKKEKRRINELTHQLDNVCKIDESDANLKKRKRDKGREVVEEILSAVLDECGPARCKCQKIDSDNEYEKLNRRIAKRKKYAHGKKRKDKLESITKDLMSVNLHETSDGEANGKENVINYKKHKKSKKSKTEQDEVV